MTFRLEITRTWYHVMSDESETWRTDAHRTEHAEMAWESEEKLEYDSPVGWAVAVLSNEGGIVATPWMAGFPPLEPSSYPIGIAARPSEWLSGTVADNYTNEECEWSIRLLSPEWAPEMRAEVFRRVTGME